MPIYGKRSARILRHFRSHRFTRSRSSEGPYGLGLGSLELDMHMLIVRAPILDFHVDATRVALQAHQANDFHSDLIRLGVGDAIGADVDSSH